MGALNIPPASMGTIARLLGPLLAIPVVLGALLHLVPGVPAFGRELVPLALRPDHPATSQALALLGANLRAVAIPLFCALALSASRRRPPRIIHLRVLLDAVLIFSSAANAGVLTIAIAGYGLVRLAPWLPHLPVELAAMALALSCYLSTRRGLLRPRHIAAAAAQGAALLSVAAVLETWATPHA
jgi:hypothetical protein